MHILYLRIKVLASISVCFPFAAPIFYSVYGWSLSYVLPCARAHSQDMIVYYTLFTIKKIHSSQSMCQWIWSLRALVIMFCHGILCSRNLRWGHHRRWTDRLAPSNHLIFVSTLIRMQKSTRYPRDLFYKVLFRGRNGAKMCVFENCFVLYLFMQQYSSFPIVFVLLEKKDVVGFRYVYESRGTQSTLFNCLSIP